MTEQNTAPATPEQLRDQREWADGIHNLRQMAEDLGVRAESLPALPPEGPPTAEQAAEYFNAWRTCHYMARRWRGIGVRQSESRYSRELQYALENLLDACALADGGQPQLAAHKVTGGVMEHLKQSRKYLTKGGGQ